MNKLTGYMRRFNVTVFLNSQNISRNLSPYISAWSYNDYLTGNIDYVSLTLSDDEQRVIKDWFPKLGDIIKIWINCQYWYRGTDKPLKSYFGAFSIDNISANFPPSVVTIRARALPLVSTSSRQIRNQSWEKTSLKTIASDIAKRCKLELKFKGEDFKYDRVQQTNQTDLEFLNKLTVEQQKCMKITTDPKTKAQVLWIHDEEELEKGKVQMTITPQTEMVNRSLNIDFTKIFKSAQVVSTNSKKKGVIKSTATDKNIDGVERQLVVKKRVADKSSAEKLAKNALKEKNKRKWTAQFTLPLGNPATRAGVVWELKDFGKFSRKYLVEEVIHNGSSAGYVTTVKLRGIESQQAEVKTTVTLPPVRVRKSKGRKRKGRMRKK